MKLPASQPAPTHLPAARVGGVEDLTHQGLSQATRQSPDRNCPPAVLWNSRSREERSLWPCRWPCCCAQPLPRQWRTRRGSAVAPSLPWGSGCSIWAGNGKEQHWGVGLVSGQAWDRKEGKTAIFGNPQCGTSHCHVKVELVRTQADTGRTEHRPSSPTSGV